MIALRGFESACPAFPADTALRYMGIRPAEAPTEMRELAEHACTAVRGAAYCRAAYTRLPVRVTEESVTLGPLTFHSVSLARNLAGCEEAYLFAATLGLAVERLIARGRLLSAAQAVAADAAGSAAVETWCDEVCARLREQCGLYLRPRFSPGYGDLPITAQADLCGLLDIGRRLGMELTAGMMLLPTKSVTAIAGISGSPVSCGGAGCAGCEKTDCPYRA